MPRSVKANRERERSVVGLVRGSKQRKKNLFPATPFVRDRTCPPPPPASTKRKKISCGQRTYLDLLEELVSPSLFVVEQGEELDALPLTEADRLTALRVPQDLHPIVQRFRVRAPRNRQRIRESHLSVVEIFMTRKRVGCGAGGVLKTRCCPHRLGESPAQVQSIVEEATCARLPGNLHPADIFYRWAG